MDSLFRLLMFVVVVLFCFQVDAVTVRVPFTTQTGSPARVNNVTFTLRRLNSGTPAIPRDGSTFDYSYNPAFVQGSADVVEGLIVRSQNRVKPPDPFAVGPSVLTYSSMTRSGPSTFSFSLINESTVVIEPSDVFDDQGCEDPRVVYREKDGLYYMFYTGIQYPFDIRNSVMCLATSASPHIKNSWVKHGNILPGEFWTKSGALLLRDDPKYEPLHFLFWGDTGAMRPGLQLATTTDLLSYTHMKNYTWLKPRSDHFDSLLVEAGPPPMQLSNGQYLFLYNSARHGYPTKKPDWDQQYNVGWVILDEMDPTTILARSEDPLFGPKLSWEIGEDWELTPDAVFLEAMMAVPGSESGSAADAGADSPTATTDSFYLFYGAADSVVGVARLDVTICVAE